MTLATELPATLPRRRTLGAAAALALQGSVLLAFLAASTAPSPLYAEYRALWHFSPLVLTAVFASYALALLAALLVLGRLSDHLGRRPLTVAALVLELVSMWLFREAASVGDLFAARIVQGLATGMVMSAVGASLIDLHPLRGALVNSLAPMIGMAVGALVSAALVQWHWHPLQHAYDGLAVVLVAQLLLMRWLPETAPGRPGVWASLRPVLALPAAARPTLRAVLPINTAQWALGGFFMSLGPSLVAQLVGPGRAYLGGGLIALLVLSGAAAIGWVRVRDPLQAMRGGAAVLALGLAGALVAIALHQPAGLFGATAVAGLGFGAAFNGSLRRLALSTGPADRAGLMATFFVCSYLAFAVPAVLAGLGAQVWGLEAVSLGYGAVLLGLALMALRR